MEDYDSLPYLGIRQMAFKCDTDRKKITQVV